MSRRDGKSISTVKSQVEKSGNIIQELSENLVDDYCGELDEEMKKISNMLICSQNMTDNEIEFEILNLANILYFTCSAQEDLGIKEDVCKSIRAEVYNKERELAKGTVADKNASAELKAQEETTVLAIYSRAYKKVKLRVEAGYEMLNSLKKVMNKRISEMELSNSRFIGGNKHDL